MTFRAINVLISELIKASQSPRRFESYFDWIGSSVRFLSRPARRVNESAPVVSSVPQTSCEMVENQCTCGERDDPSPRAIAGPARENAAAQRKYKGMA